MPSDITYHQHNHQDQFNKPPTPLQQQQPSPPLHAQAPPGAPPAPPAPPGAPAPPGVPAVDDSASTPTSIDPLDTTNNHNSSNNDHFASTPRSSAPISTANLRQSSATMGGSNQSNLPTLHKYSRRVSFNNLNPVDDGDFLYNRPIYNQVGNTTASGKHYASYSGPSSTSTTAGGSGGSDATSPLFAPAQLGSGNNDNYRYGSSPTRQSSFPFANLPKVPNFDVISQSPGYYSSQQQQRKRRLKLPNPPAKSILKNKVSQQQLDYNYRFGGNIEDATINYHQEEEDAHAEEEEEGEQEVRGEENDPSGKDTEQPQRRKSYAGMTNEELLALDPQFNMKPKTSNFDAFKFDNQKIYYTNRRSSTSGVSALEKLQAQQQQQYPSSNENNYRSIAVTVQHDDYDEIELRRTLLTTISGRKHSWNSLDWLLQIDDSILNQNQLILHDGDYLIVASFIPHKFIKDYNAKRRKQSCDEYLKSKCFNLLEYLKFNLAQLNVRIKMTVEFVVENGLETVEQHGNEFGSKFMLNKLVKQYHPNVFIVGIKSSNLNFKYKIKKNSERSYLVKYSSFIVKHAGIPVVLVSNLSKYPSHEHTRQLQTQQQQQQQQQQHTKSLVPKITFSDDLVAVGTNSSSSIESVESFVPQTIPTDELGNTGVIIDTSIPYNSMEKYHSWLSSISDKSFNDSVNYLQAIHSKDDSIKIDGKIHQIYKSQLQFSSLGATSTNGSSISSRNGSVASDGSGGVGGGVGGNENVYRVKSLISIEDDEDAKRRKEMRQKRRASGSNGTSGSSGGILSSMKSNDSGGSSGNETKGKKSFWRKIGFKKG